jgi:hypothetical protein
MPVSAFMLTSALNGVRGGSTNLSEGGSYHGAPKMRHPQKFLKTIPPKCNFLEPKCEINIM